MIASHWTEKKENPFPHGYLVILEVWITKAWFHIIAMDRESLPSKMISWNRANMNYYGMRL